MIMRRRRIMMMIIMIIIIAAFVISALNSFSIDPSEILRLARLKTIFNKFIKLNRLYTTYK